MKLFRHSKVKDISGIISEDIVKEITEFEQFTDRYKKKLELVLYFVRHWQRAKTWDRFEKMMDEVKKITFIDLKNLKKRKKYYKKELDDVEKAIGRTIKPEIKQILKYVLEKMKLLNNIYIDLKKTILDQINWFIERGKNIWFEHEYMREFIRLIEEEASLLSETGLTHESCKQVLKEIYDQIMPLKERYEIQHIGTEACTPILIKPKFGGHPYVFKRYGSMGYAIRAIGRHLKREEALQQKEVLLQYYDYFRKAGINVPHRGAIQVIMLGRDKDGKKFYGVALKERYILENVHSLFKNLEIPDDRILKIYKGLLNLVHKDIQAGNKYDTDYLLMNFCVLHDDVYYIDLEPPLYQFKDWEGNVRFRLVKTREGMEYFKKIARVRQPEYDEKLIHEFVFRRITITGKFWFIALFSFVLRPNLENEFQQVLLDFLEKKRYGREKKYFEKIFSNEDFQHEIEFWIRSFQRDVNMKKRTAIILPPASPGSLGDEALLKATINILKQKAFVKIAVIAYQYPSELDSYGKIDGVINMSKYFKKIYLQDNEIKKILRGYDNFFCLGADVLDGYYSEKHSLWRIGLIRMANEVGLKTTVLGFSFSEHPKSGPVKEMRNLPENIVLCSRDPVAYEMIYRSLKRKIRRTADIAFLLPPEKTAMTDKIQQWINEAHSKGRLVMMINPRYKILSKYAGADLEKIISTYVDLIKGLFSENNGLSLLFISHDFRELKGDITDYNLSKMIIKQLPFEIKQNCKNLRPPFKAAEVYTICSFVDFILTGRMHLAIASLSMKTPVVCFTYKNKVEGLFKHFKLEELLIQPIEFMNVNRMIKYIQANLSRRGQIKAQINSEIRTVLRKALMNFEE